MKTPKLGKEVDYTRWKARGRVKPCPKCGRNGAGFVVPFKSGDKLYVTHKKVFTGLAWTVTDGCVSPVKK